MSMLRIQHCIVDFNTAKQCQVEFTEVMDTPRMPVAATLLNGLLQLSPEVADYLNCEDSELMFSLRSIKHVILQPIDNSSNQCVGDKAAPISLSLLHDQLQHHKGYEVFDVAADDPRIALRGQKRLVATKAFDNGEIIWAYGMWLGTQDEYFCELNDIIMTHGAAAGLELHRYAMGIKSRAMGNMRLKATAAFHHGNEMRYINDGRRVPFSNIHDFAVQPNVYFDEVTAAGKVPVVLVRALRPIQLQDELVADYGSVYWEALNANMAAVAAWATAENGTII